MSTLVPAPESLHDVVLADVVASLRDAGCVFAEDEARLLVSAVDTPLELAAAVTRRVSGVPLEHVLGWAEFCGLRVVVDPGVFVPRRRTELLVAIAAERLRTAAARAAPPIVVDLCCGSGAVGAALMAATPIDLHAVDVDPAAVSCARRNVCSGGGRVYEGDLFQPLPATIRGGVEVIVANAPYVPTAELVLLPPEARLYEPRIALDGGVDGTAVQRRIIAEAPGWLSASGHVLVETTRDQAPLVEQAMRHSNSVPHVVTDDELAATVVVGSLSD